MDAAARQARPGRRLVLPRLTAILLILLVTAPVLAAILSSGGSPIPTSAVGAGRTGSDRVALQSSSGPTVWLSLDHAYGYAPFQTNITVSASGGSAPYNLTFCPSSANCERDNAWMGTPWPIREQFTTPGNYSVNATVIDANGATGIATALIQVLAVQPLTAGFSEASARGAAPFVDAFNVLVGGGVGPYSVTWTFGDGTSMVATAGAPVNHTYETAGDFTPQVTVRDSRGAILERALPSVTVLTASAPPSSGGLTGLSFGYLALIVSTATIAIAATAGVGYAWYARRLQREANELVSQLWEEDARGPRDGP